MVGTNGVEDIRSLSRLFGQLHAQQCVWQFAFLVAHLANVVQQSCPFCGFGVQSELCSHCGAEVGYLAAVLQEVLSIAGAVLHPADHADQRIGHVRYAQVNDRTLASLQNLFFDLLRGLGHDFFNARGVDAAIRDELVKAEPRDLSSHGVEAADDDGFGGVIHNELNASGCFQSPDVSTLTANNAAFDVVASDVKDRNAVLDGVLRGHPLDGLDHDLFGVLIGSAARIIQDVLHLLCRHGSRVTQDLLLKLALRGIYRQARHFSEQFGGLSLRFFELFVLGFIGIEPRLEGFLVALQPRPAVPELLVVSLEIPLLVFQFVFKGLDFAVAVFEFLAVLFLELQKLLLGLKDFLLLDVFAFLLSFFDDLVRFALKDAVDKDVCQSSS